MAGTNSKAPEKTKADVQKTKKKTKEAMSALTVSLNNLSIDQQLPIVLSKYSELVEENLALQSTCKQLEKSLTQTQNEKERSEVEHSKAVLTRGRLESLCRELQKQNKLIKEESVERMKEEQHKRKELSNQLNNSLGDIHKVLEESTTRNNQLKEENIKNATRIQEVLKEHSTMEQAVQQSLAQKQLEIQYKEAEIAKAKLEFAEEREKLLREKKSLLEELSGYQGKVQKFSVNEVTLRSQLNMYSEKCDDFQDKIDKSNSIFKQFQQRMDEMTKIIKQYEKETKIWKDRWEKTNKALLQMATERTHMQTKAELQDKQIEKLQSLCRALQKQNNEIRSLQKQIEEAEAKREEAVESLEAAEDSEINVASTNESDTPSESVSDAPLSVPEESAKDISS